MDARILIVGGPHDGTRVSRSIASNQPYIRMPDPPELRGPVAFLPDEPPPHCGAKATTYTREWFWDDANNCKHDMWVHANVDSLIGLLLDGYKSKTNHPCESCEQLEGRVDRLEIVIAGLREEVLAHKEFSNFSVDMLRDAMGKRKP